MGEEAAQMITHAPKVKPQHLQEQGLISFLLSLFSIWRNLKIKLKLKLKKYKKTTKKLLIIKQTKWNRFCFWFPWHTNCIERSNRNPYDCSHFTLISFDYLLKRKESEEKKWKMKNRNCKE